MTDLSKEHTKDDVSADDRVTFLYQVGGAGDMPTSTKTGVVVEVEREKERFLPIKVRLDDEGDGENGPFFTYLAPWEIVNIRR